jgi:hypothetical protein
MSVLKSKKSMIIAGVVAAGIIALGTTAYAVFSTSGSASASGATGTVQPLVQNGGATVDYPNSETGLWPNVDSNGNVPSDPAYGNHLATVDIPVYNANEVAVIVKPSNLSAVFTTASAPVCSPYVHTLSTLSLGAPSVTIPAHTTVTLHVSSIYLDANVDNTCAGLSFTSQWTINAQIA